MEILSFMTETDTETPALDFKGLKDFSVESKFYMTHPIICSGNTSMILRISVWGKPCIVNHVLIGRYCVKIQLIILYSSAYFMDGKNSLLFEDTCVVVSILAISHL